MYTSDLLSGTSAVTLTTKQNSNPIEIVNVHTSLVQLEGIMNHVLKFRTRSSSLTVWMNVLEYI